MLPSNRIENPDDDSVTSNSGDIENFPATTNPSLPAAADHFTDTTHTFAADMSVQSRDHLVWSSVSPSAGPTISPISTQRPSQPPRPKLLIAAVVLLAVCTLTMTTLFLTKTFGLTTFFQPNSANNQQSGIDIKQESDAEFPASNGVVEEDNIQQIYSSTISPTTAVPPVSHTLSFTPTLQPTMEIESMMLESEADTFVEFNNPNPQGESMGIKVDGSPKMISLIRFKTRPLIDIGVNIIRAQLRLYSLADTPNVTVDLLLGCDDWREENLSWSNAPTCVFDDANTVGSFGAIEQYVWNTANLSLATELLATSTKATLRLSSSVEEGVMFASRQNETAVPELKVDFHRTAAPTFSPTTKSPTTASPTTYTPTKMPTSMSPTSSTIPPSLTPYPTSHWPTFAPAV
ncbi:hypothetical protein ACHAXM_001634 [Skeletonema potamos]